MAIALVIALAGCPGGKKNEPTTVATGSGTGLTHLVKRTIVSWGFSPDGQSTDVFLAATDETGSQTSHPVGKFPGKCEKLTTVPKEMNAILAARCAVEGKAGVELHAVRQQNEVIVLKMPFETSDPMAREEVVRVAIALGAAIEGAP
jgi:hypothetical protein